MSVIFAAAIRTILDLKRKCPKCGHGQFVSSDKRHQSVTCKACGAPIPPRK
jgi:ribosomal protein S27E